MDVKTYRAKTMQEALVLVRRDLGPEAAVLHTRDVRGGGLLGLLLGSKRVEVTASNQVSVPSRMPARSQGIDLSRPDEIAAHLGADALKQSKNKQTAQAAAIPHSAFPIPHFADSDPAASARELETLVDDLCRRSRHSEIHELPESLFRLFTDLIEADVQDELARELVERVRREMPPRDLLDTLLVKAHLARTIEEEIRVAGPIRGEPGRRRVVALVGPTGVGKTTTIAKLAANFRLKEKRKVGLITVDTYRIAAVEQLRTYADIIDLPMAVVSTPREMREAVTRMSELEIVLMDTAGRSPRDEVKIQELRTMLIEAKADEVHLVLSAVGSAGGLKRTAEQFTPAGITALVLTKLDEATSLGNVLPLLRASKLPLSYVTDGQNVPDDIEAADQRRLARMILGMELK
jgi:flagellar biosynthesis protein FlhF